MENNETEMNLSLGACCPSRGNEHWWIFIITTTVLYVMGFTVSSLTYIIHRLVRKSKTQRQRREPSRAVLRSNYYHRFRRLIQQLISGDTLSSKILITTTFVCNIIYLLIYVHRTYTPFPVGTSLDGQCINETSTITTAVRVEKCFTFVSSPGFAVELVIVIELIFFAILNFLATDSVIYYWLNIYTIVDIFTLPHIFVSIVLGVDWVGLRSLRFIWLPQIVNVIRFLPFVKSQDAVDVVSLLIKFIALWLSCTGIIHLIEAQGDFWTNYDNGGTDSFLTYAYYIMVTVSTVGYGDISPQTSSGRAFITFFIILGLAFFAAILPTIADVASGFYKKRQFAKFDTTRVPQHVIVCGHITAFSAEEFLKDFLHPDRGDTQTHVLFLHPQHPNAELKNVIRSHYTRVQYLVGSVLKGKDLQRAKILKSRAVFVMANKFATSPLEEDNANLLRLVSVKNTTMDVPVIIQLLLSTSKKQVSNIDGWKLGRDIALCLNELKLGLLAQNCICPGISTLVANLFYTSNFSALNFFKENDAWKEQYIEGASNEIYASHLSHQFERKTFHEAAKICYNQLGLILLSLEKIEGNVRTCYVNPSPDTNPDLVIESGPDGMLGYFIGQDADHVAVVASYCECCHGNENVNVGDKSPQVKKLVRRVSTNNCRCEEEEAPTRRYLPKLIEVAELGEDEETKKPTPSKTFNRSKLFSQAADSTCLLDLIEQFSIYVREPQKLDEAIITDESAIMADSPRPDIKDHVVLCVFADETSPLLGLHNFLLPLRSKYMPKDQLKPVVIVSNKRFIEREWPLIRKIPDIYIVIGSPLRWQNLEDANINECSVCIIVSMLSCTKFNELAMSDKESILCSLSVQEHLKKTAKRNILIITDLKVESNVQFLDFGDEDEPDERIYKAQPFACGEAFSVSMFDSVTSSAFHSPGTLYLVEDLVHASGTVTRSQVLPLSLANYAGRTFADLYIDQLKRNSVCLGLYRQLPTSDKVQNVHQEQEVESYDSVKQTKHYVITAPPPNLRLESTDFAFILVEQVTTAE